ncbi:MAG: hypothetical protein ABWY23_05860 [Mycetocola sp.]
MRLYLDENLPPFLVEPLSLVYAGHEFRSYRDEELAGDEDIPLFAELKRRGFDAIITRDRNQMRNPEERDAIGRAGLRWIGLADKKIQGLELLTVTVASLVAGLRFVFDHNPDEPVCYVIQNVPRAQDQRIRMYPLARRT